MLVTFRHLLRSLVPSALANMARHDVPPFASLAIIGRLGLWPLYPYIYVYPLISVSVIRLEESISISFHFDIFTVYFAFIGSAFLVLFPYVFFGNYCNCFAIESIFFLFPCVVYSLVVTPHATR